jgi:hypothetical protein
MELLVGGMQITLKEIGCSIEEALMMESSLQLVSVSLLHSKYHVLAQHLSAIQIFALVVVVDVLITLMVVIVNRELVS